MNFRKSWGAGVAWVLMGTALAACSAQTGDGNAESGALSEALTCREAASHACEMAETSSSRTVHAALPGAPLPAVVSGELYGVRLASDGAVFAGAIALEAQRSGIHHVYLGTPNMPLVVADTSTGQVLTPLDGDTLSCTKLRRVFSFRFERGKTYSLAFGPIAPQSWVRLYIEGDVDVCEEAPARLAEAQADALRSTSIPWYFPATYALQVDAMYVLELLPDQPRSVDFVPARTGKYDLFLGSPNAAHDVLTSESNCAELASCKAYVSEAGSLIRAADAYTLEAGKTYHLTFAPGGSPETPAYVRLGMYSAPTVCSVNNGGCDPLTTCDSPDDVTAVCGACPAGYMGEGATGCVDINECLSGTDNCDSDPDACVNTPGSFQCVCPAEQPGSGFGEQGCGGGATVKLALGNSFGCAYWPDGLVKCWGDNATGQLGLGDRANRGDQPGEMGAALPFVDTGVPVTQIATMPFGSTCALGTDGLVRCWGANSNGEVGAGSSATYVGRAPGEMGANLRPVLLGTGMTVRKLVGMTNSMCALTSDAKVKCWGENGRGQLGIGDSVDRGRDAALMGDALPAVDLGSDFAATDLACADNSCCALSDAGRVKCWGMNYQGILGLGVPWGDAVAGYTNRGDDPGEMGDNLPYVDLGTDEIATSLHAGIDYMCAVLASGGIKCWGDSNDGGAGAGKEIDVGDGPGEMGDSLPKVNLGSEIVLKSLSDGAGAQMCAVLNDGQLRCWGLSGAGLGYPATNPRGDGPNEMGDFLPFLELGTGRKVVKDVRGRFFGCALLDDASVKCWGGNRAGALGAGDTTDRGLNASQMGDALPTLDLGR